MEALQNMGGIPNPPNLLMEADVGHEHIPITVTGLDHQETLPKARAPFQKPKTKRKPNA
jgi:hypothetical protein